MKNLSPPLTLRLGLVFLNNKLSKLSMATHTLLLYVCKCPLSVMDIFFFGVIQKNHRSHPRIGRGGWLFMVFDFTSYLLYLFVFFSKCNAIQVYYTIYLHNQPQYCTYLQLINSAVHATHVSKAILLKRELVHSACWNSRVCISMLGG